MSLCFWWTTLILELSCLYEHNVYEGKGQPKKLHMEEGERGELRGRQGGREGIYFLLIIFLKTGCLTFAVE